MSGPTTFEDFEDLVPPGVEKPREWLEDLAVTLNPLKLVDAPVGAVKGDPADVERALKALGEWALGEADTDPRVEALRRDLVHWLLRPALRITAPGGVHVADAVAPPVWGAFQAAIERVVAASGPSVGRVDVEVAGKRVHLGTAWVVAEDGDDWVLLTAAHVLADAAQLGFPSLATLRVDFDCLDGPSAAAVSADRPVRHADLDLATIRVARAVAPGLRPLPLETAAPTPLRDHPALVVGHPGFRDEAHRQFATTTVGFDGTAGVKRASPGRLRDVVPPIPTLGGAPRWRTAFAHDATTLGGNSGSPVFSLVHERVLGVHVGGKPTGHGPSWFVDNYALPVWVPAATILKALGLPVEPSSA